MLLPLRKLLDDNNDGPSAVPLSEAQKVMADWLAQAEDSRGADTNEEHADQSSPSPCMAQLIAVLDIDSSDFSAFDEFDKVCAGAGNS